MFIVLRCKLGTGMDLLFVVNEHVLFFSDINNNIIHNLGKKIRLSVRPAYVNKIVT